MSITSPFPDEQGLVNSAIGHSCFFCHTLLDDPAVCWSGADADIYLHPDCVPDLAVRMFRDVHEIRNSAYYRRRGLGATSS